MEVGDSLGVVARAAGAGKTSVHRWFNGTGLPEQDARRKLRAAYGIPVEAWEQAPARRKQELAIEPEEDVDADVPANTAAHLLELMRDIRRIKRGLSPSEQVKATKDEGSLRSQYERALDKVARDWDRVIRESPQWIAFTDALMRALDKHPDAKTDVLEVLERMGP